MDNKISELTDKLYKEGVEKGEKRAEQIVAEAQTKAAQIISDAKKEAERITASAKALAEELKRTVASEIKLSGQQALAAIKRQILDILMAKAIDTGVTRTLDDPEVMKELIVAVVQNWKVSAGQNLSLDVLLPEARRQEMEKSLVGALQKQLKNSVTVTFSKAFSNGFQIGPAGASYKVSLTDQDFIEYFKGFLRPKAKSFLFGDTERG